MKSKDQDLKEEGICPTATNNIGNGNIAAIDPPLNKKKKLKDILSRRKRSK